MNMIISIVLSLFFLLSSQGNLWAKKREKKKIMISYYVSAPFLDIETLSTNHLNIEGSVFGITGLNTDLVPLKIHRGLVILGSLAKPYPSVKSGRSLDTITKTMRLLDGSMIYSSNGGIFFQSHLNGLLFENNLKKESDSMFVLRSDELITLRAGIQNTLELNQDKVSNSGHNLNNTSKIVLEGTLISSQKKVHWRNSSVNNDSFWGIHVGVTGKTSPLTLKTNQAGGNQSQGFGRFDREALRFSVGNSSNDSSQPRGFEIEKLGKSLLSIEGTTGTLKVPKDFVVNGAILEKGNTLFPLGAILVYRGTASSIPRGWVLCNGQNGTPNLVGKFIKGASAVQNKANIDKTATSNSHNHSYHAPPVPIDLSHVHPGGNYGKTKNLSTGSPMGGLVAILPTDRIQRNERQTEPSRIHTHKRSPSDVYVPKMVHSEIRNHDLNLTVNSDSSVALPPYMDLYYIMKVNNLQ